MTDLVTAITPPKRKRRNRSTTKLVEAPPAKKLKDPPSLKALAQATCSIDAVKQFCQLVTAARDPNTDSWNLFPAHDEQARVSQMLDVIRGSESHKTLKKIFLARYAKEVDDKKQGQLISDSEFLRREEKRLNMTPQQHRQYRAQGRQWRHLAQGFDGLLCLMPLASYHYLGITQDDTPTFHEYLLQGDNFRVLLESARQFEASLNMGPNVVFRWETEDKAVIDWEEPLSGIIDHIRPCPPPLQDNIVPEDWLQKWPDPQPLNWPASLSWPADILHVASGTQWCICKTKNEDCRCYDVPLPEPRIRRYPGKGLGLQAVGQEAGKVVYKRNNRIGFLTGHIVPRGIYTDFWSFDIGKNGCEIHCHSAGSIFRFLNHSCAPVAQVRPRLLSGRWRLEVVAKKDIYDRAEITIDYESQWDVSKCLCGDEKCRGKVSELGSEVEVEEDSDQSEFEPSEHELPI